MFIEHFQITGIAVLQIFMLSAVGFLLVRKRFLSGRGLDDLSRLVMDVSLPVLIFCQLIKDFSFCLYPNWWVFPLISIAITVFGLVAGFLFVRFIDKEQEKLQFLSLVAFQNSGYLPLALVAALFPAQSLGEIFIYLFLFLMGFNLVMFSLGVHILNFHKEKKIKLSSLLSMPVLATLLGLVIVYFGINKLFPDSLIKPLRILGDTTLPLAMIVVGGNLAQINLKAINKKAVILLILVKMIILPLSGILFLRVFNISGLLGLLILIQLAMPSAVTVSTILRASNKEDILASQGIFITHLAALITVPAFLILYFSNFMIK
ncbi:MAG: Membrane transport protein [Candidatus Omnitrophica bacterium ADurb.Bin205]|nr:MAG: Membrane transport protein [Candidatus Omnitrophica bacterium ADurb.Bin205]